MTYSVESLVFRAVAGVVNTAARAANGLLEVMYPPRYDVAHIWEDVPAGSVASGGPAPTDPPSGGVADPAAEKVNPPDLSAAGSLNPDLVSFFELQCIAEEILRGHLLEGPVGTAHLFTCSCREQFHMVGEWSDHVAEIQISAITDRLRVAHIAAASFQPE